MNRHFHPLLLLLAMACLPLSVKGKPRSSEQILSAAKQVLQSRHGAKALGPQNRPLKVLRQTQALTVVGYDHGGFAVVCNDDVLPAVMGYSSSTYNDKTPNPNFKWWLEAMEGAVNYAAQQQQSLSVTKPDPTAFETSVAPLVPCKWGQTEPYWNFCPYTTGQCVTGCVATAMAQIMYYHRTPVSGMGSHTIYAPYDDPNGVECTVDFGSAVYDYDNMLDEYVRGDYTPQQGDAVALLMYHAGVASNMMYDPSGSGTYTEDAQVGLHDYFGFETCLYANRYDYSEKEWMELVYEEISNGRPILYTGVDWYSGGHAFVLDGYDENGLVSINWGWNGDDDGFYDIASLNPPGYSFSSFQDIVYHIEGAQQADPLAGEFVVEQPGDLEQLIAEDDLFNYTEVKVSGAINSTDLRLLRMMAGVDQYGKPTKGRLARLDLTEATIVEGGEPYLMADGAEYTTAADDIPFCAFFGCKALSTLRLPSMVKTIQKGAFGACRKLQHIDITNGDDKAYYYAGGELRTNDEEHRLIEVMPFVTGTYEVEDGVEELGDYVFAGCSRLTGIKLPGTIKAIGDHALYGCTGLAQLRVLAKEVPVVMNEGLGLINGSKTKLYVVAGMKSKFKQSSYWKIFYNNIGGNRYDNIEEFGTLITARNAIKEYGEENPRFGYRVYGDIPTGDPEFICEATAASPVGNYDIHLERGTITNEVLELKDGYLIVAQRALKVSVGDYVIRQGEEIPDFEIKINGLVLDETPEVFISMPEATTTATSQSEPGTYPITISGGEAQNYSFDYSHGTLTIEGVADGIHEVDVEQSVDATVYSLDGREVSSPIRRAPLPKGVYVVRGKKMVVK